MPWHYHHHQHQRQRRRRRRSSSTNVPWEAATFFASVVVIIAAGMIVNIAGLQPASLTEALAFPLSFPVHSNHKHNQNRRSAARSCRSSTTRIALSSDARRHAPLPISISIVTDDGDGAIEDASAEATLPRRGGTSLFARNAAALVAAASLSLVVATAVPMPAAATMPPSFDQSPVTLLALAMSQSQSQSSSSSSPNTGQLVDTTNAVIVKLDSGVTYRDLREGTSGDGVAREGKRVNIQWSLKRNNGYSIDSSAQNDGVPFIFVVGGNVYANTNGGSNSNGKQTMTTATAIPGLDEGIRGMAVGGIRRIVIPPSLAYTGGVESDSPGPVPPGFGPKQRIKRVMENRIDVPDESFMLDVKLTRVQ